jgi:hypothetical protein
MSMGENIQEDSLGENKGEESKEPYLRADKPVTLPNHKEEREDETANPKSGIIDNNMEVQKHPHHVTHKKKWREYLLEFFMLFLAVFLGFVAENIREGQVERVKEKEYMVSLLSDLKKDTLSSGLTIMANSLYIAGEDSTLNFLCGNIQQQDSAELALVYFYKYCIYNTIISITDGTISQLKNSGGMRLVKNNDVISSINDYYNSVEIVRMQEEAIKEFLNIISKQAGEIFNYKANRKFIDSINSTETDILDLPLSTLMGWLTHGTPTMITTDNKDLSPFMNNMAYQVGLMHNYNLLIGDLKTEAVELMRIIRKDYHLGVE